MVKNSQFRSGKVILLAAAWFAYLYWLNVVIFGAAAQSQPTVRSQMLVTTDWLETQLDNPDVVIVHVARTTDGYRTGHIPGARFLNRSEIGIEQNGLTYEVPPARELMDSVLRLGIGEKTRVVVYDEAAGLEAARTFVVFDYMGFGNRVALLDGQWKKWKSEQRRISTDTPSVQRPTWTPHPRPEVVLDLNVVKELALKALKPGSGVHILDSRPEAQYRGDQTPQGMRSGHIPGAKCIFWQANIVNMDNPVMRPAAELRELYKDIDLGPGNTVVTYCNIGSQASFSYFVLKYLGLDVHLYDGSMEEWSRSTNEPLEISR